ncbi:MAG: hypothetical protein LV473_03845 [Nitrospira sp.]|nr:hypothetical protein [Nitrospira sp.]
MRGRNSAYWKHSVKDRAFSQHCYRFGLYQELARDIFFGRPIDRYKMHVWMGLRRRCSSIPKYLFGFYRPGMPLLPGLSVRPTPGWDGLTDFVPAPGMPVPPGLSVRPGPGLDGLIPSSLGLGMPELPGFSVRPGPGLDGLIEPLTPPPRLPEPPGLPGEPIPEPLACATREFGIG